jgi:hypothetical protein
MQNTHGYDSRRAILYARVSADNLAPGPLHTRTAYHYLFEREFKEHDCTLKVPQRPGRWQPGRRTRRLYFRPVGRV